MSDVAGTPLPTTGSTTQTNTNSAGHSPTFTSATNGFQVTEEVDFNVSSTATNICTKVTLPSSIQFFEEYNPFNPGGPGVWWSSVDDKNITKSSASNIVVAVDQFLELLSVNYKFEGITPMNGASTQGRPYYSVEVTAVVSSQPNYQTGDVVTFTSLNTWTEGYLATAFRLRLTAGSQCLSPQIVPISSGGTVEIPVAQSTSVALPTTGSNTQTATGTGGGIGFIDGGGGEGWMDCDGDGQDDGNGNSNDSNWNQTVPNVHAPTYTEGYMAGPNGGFIVSPTNGCRQLSSGTFSIWELHDGVFIGGAIIDIYEIVSIVFKYTSGTQNPFSLCPSLRAYDITYRETPGGPLSTSGLFHGASSGCQTITWEIIPGDPTAACTIPYP